MIMLKVENVKNRLVLEKKYVTCPKCGTKAYFFLFDQALCDFCGFYFGGLDKIIEDIEMRKRYHITGEFRTYKLLE